MSKKNKNFSRDFGNEAPEIYNMDDIGYMADEAIHDRANRLENERNRLSGMGRDPHFWEVEVAYLRREQQLRQTRAEKHAEFMKKFGHRQSPEDLNVEKVVKNDNAAGPEELN